MINYRKEDNKKIVDDVAPIRTISEQDANKEFFQVKPGNMVYHTSNQDFVIHPPQRGNSKNLLLT
ncbi:hypothetical protein FQU75_08770 [Paenibacillus polymyxa]|nr:hypothetical protein FQU75_08770 [Paenibacillus polymyxa]